MSLFNPSPNPYDALSRLLAKEPRHQRRLLRLSVWCEQGACTPIRVFGHRDGLLVQCRSDADVSDMREHYPHLERWSRRRAFFADEWVKDAAGQRLQVVCECSQTTPRLVDVEKLIEAAEDDTRRNVALLELVVTDG